MATQTITVNLPKDILIALNESEGDLKKRLKIILAIQLYKLQKLSLGKAAQLSGLSRLDFETELANNKISISNLSEKDVLEDIEKLS
jgi:predicted HTH domain antitoxin